MRLQKVISVLVDPDQVGYIKARYIGENIRTIEDLMHYTSLRKVPEILALVDFEKAFDTIRWSFFFETMAKFNFFGQNYISTDVYFSVFGWARNNIKINGCFKRHLVYKCPF